MRDIYLYEMEITKEKYISEHKDQSAVNLKKFFNPQTFSESDFEIFTSDFSISPINEIKETVQWRIDNRNKSFNVSWHLCDTYSEIEVLKNSGNAFLMYIADFCKLASDIVIQERNYGYSEAFFSNVRCAELVLFQELQDVFDVQVTLAILSSFWCEYVKYNLEKD